MLSASPDEVLALPVTGTRLREHHSNGVEVHGLPCVRLQVAGYQAEVCLRCHQRQQAAFPQDVRGQVQ
ncbi:hypothetical protein [Deinococcus hopiensis]|uniref:hypothetical protein n=1 Tax=Deinococcus hopiensis TaxID=309885 RepID=UPI00111C63D1|nr:hypothetical protein [Deinococcus hopiensis]